MTTTNRLLPTNDDVRAAMDRVLDDTPTGRTPTLTSVERALGIPHATFYRNYRGLINDYFWAQVANRRLGAHIGSQPTSVHAGAATEEQLRRLRCENDDLRRLVGIYGEAIRQLTLDNNTLQARLDIAASVTALPPR